MPYWYVQVVADTEGGGAGGFGKRSSGSSLVVATTRGESGVGGCVGGGGGGGGGGGMKYKPDSTASASQKSTRDWGLSPFRSRTTTLRKGTSKGGSVAAGAGR